MISKDYFDINKLNKITCKLYRDYSHRMQPVTDNNRYRGNKMFLLLLLIDAGLRLIE